MYRGRVKALMLNAHGGQRGGSQKSIRSLALALAEAGHTVWVAAPAGAWLDALAERGVQVVSLEAPQRFGGQLHQAGFRNLARVVGLIFRHQIEVLHSFQYGSYLLARAAAAMTGRGAVHTVLGPLSPGHRFAEGPTVCVSEQFALDAADAGATDTRVVPGRIDVGDFATRVSDLGRGEPGGVRERRVVLISRLDGHLAMGARHFLTASELSGAGARWEVAGDGEALKTQRAEWPEVHFAGHVRDMSHVHRRADVVVGGGRGLLEAMAAGVVCVNLGPGGLGGVVSPETVDAMAWHNMSGRHAAGSTALALAGAIDELLADDGMRARLGAWSPGWVQARYATETAVAAYGAAWRDAASAAPGLASTGGLGLRLAASKAWRTMRRTMNAASVG